jgi:hypothetical protein
MCNRTHRWPLLRCPNLGSNGCFLASRKMLLSSIFTMSCGLLMRPSRVLYHWVDLLGHVMNRCA